MKPRQSMNDLRAGTPRVEVEWIDSQRTGEWHAEHDAIRMTGAEDHLLCCSIGYMIYEDDHKVVLTQSFAAQENGTRDVQSVITIPRVAVREIRELRR